MKTDLEILPGREETEIGERGINMSGGQKQRINIARGVYSDSDIYLIDDALSALDAYVGKKIMDKVFAGELANKTRVMVTHYLHLLDQVDRVVFIDKGKIAAIGTYEELKQLESFKAFASDSDGQDKEEESEETPEPATENALVKDQEKSEVEDSQFGE